MSFNRETFELMIKFAGAMLGLLMLVFVLAVVTPKLAKVVDRLLGRIDIDNGNPPSPERVEGENEGSTAAEKEYKVYDIYEGNPSEENENIDKKD